ncbi:excinuclease ABC subunit C [Marinicauda salina]|jgi:putative endonuclease|uniref:Excinuclease ABC subunit C n=1 Tax=Marinicauda salina TaxID=2135793 RepID=A0A2U2BX32_9PROT|nr:GIY-YIG nuclease family protein [Marinicauda salina]PWE18557.1 excinuclease ABC subunit C [Marinicauda salina]
MYGAWVYILTNRPYGVLYIGMCNAELIRRMWEHRCGAGSRFTAKYNLTRLVYFEGHVDVMGAAERERRMKKWRRAWKIELIESVNPDWRDLYPDLLT